VMDSSALSTFYSIVKWYLEHESTPATVAFKWLPEENYRDVFDWGIASKNHQLRLPGSWKRAKPPSTALLSVDPCDDPERDFRNCISQGHLGVFEQRLGGVVDPTIWAKIEGRSAMKNTAIVHLNTDLNQALEEIPWFEQFQVSGDGVKGSIQRLLRIMPGKCPISGLTHDSDNAYLILGKGSVRFGCYRGCCTSNGSKTIEVSVKVDVDVEVEEDEEEDDVPETRDDDFVVEMTPPSPVHVPPLKDVKWETKKARDRKEKRRLDTLMINSCRDAYQWG
jgi:hypothetical protein